MEDVEKYIQDRADRTLRRRSRWLKPFDYLGFSTIAAGALVATLAPEILTDLSDEVILGISAVPVAWGVYILLRVLAVRRRSNKFAAQAVLRSVVGDSE